VPKRSFDPHKFFLKLKLYAVEIVSAILFIRWLLGALWHEIR
jgi:hypothetical protein